MKFFPSDFRLLRFRSDDLPAHQRLAGWSEVLSRMLLKVDIESLSPQPFHVDASLRALPGIRFGMGVFGPSMSRRTREMAAADSDDFYLIINTEGPLSILQPNTDIALGEGDACFMSCAQEAGILRPAIGRLIFARFERAPLVAHVPDIEDFAGHIVRSGNEALQLLMTYLRDLDDRQKLLTAELRGMVIAHIYDLLALVLNSSRGGVNVARSGAVVAQLHAVKKYVAENLARPDLSIAQASAANLLSSRHVQRLFRAEQTTFSEFLLLKRLQTVHAVLTDPKQRQRGVGDIALASGFGDVSSFNRAFRRHYGISPSAVRRSAAAATPPFSRETRR
jgi:AraC-like DNA-binding protein